MWSIFPMESTFKTMQSGETPDVTDIRCASF